MCSCSHWAWQARISLSGANAPVMPQHLALTALGAALCTELGADISLALGRHPASSWTRCISPLTDVIQGLSVSILLFLLTRVSAAQKKFHLVFPIFNVLSWQPLVFVGTFSYSIYLLHLILIYAVRDFLTAHTAQPAAAGHLAD